LVATLQYARLFRWHVLRYVLQHPLLAALNVTSVALGVAVYFAVQIANHSANKSFAATMDLVAGKAHLQITSPGSNLADKWLPIAAAQPGVSAATPVVRGLLSLPDFPGDYLDLLGIDVFTNEPFRIFELTGFTGHDFDIHEWLGRRDLIAVTDQFARKHKLRPGDALRVQVNGGTRILQIGFVLSATTTRGESDSHFAAMDIGWAQELLDRRGRLTSIDLRLQHPEGRQPVIARLAGILPPDVSVASPMRRSEQVEKMLAGFELNLTAMSLVSLLVGTFLIYNTISASVLRRQREIGILRSLGVRRNEVRALFLGEAVTTGALAIVMGLAAGLMLAKALVGTVSNTISSLYVLLTVQQIYVPPSAVFTAATLGLLAVIGAAWLPAHAAATMNPVLALHPPAFTGRVIRGSFVWLICGAALLIGAVFLSWLALATGPAWFGFAAAFCVLAGFSLLSPTATSLFSRAASALLARLRGRLKTSLVELSLASDNLGRGLRRNAVTIAALAAAVAMAIGVSVMIFSFRQTVGTWIEQTLIADLFITPASNEIAGPSSFISADAIAFLKSHSDVAAVDTVRQIEVPFRGESIALGVIGGSDRRNLRFIHGERAHIMNRFYREQCVLVSESFSRRFRIREGAVIQLATPQGVRDFEIAGVFIDYTRDRGLMFISAAHFHPLWNDDRINSVAVYLKHPESADTVIEAFRNQFSRAGEFAIYPNHTLRDRIFEVFDQTFAVTYVLRTIAIIVAIVGIVLSFTILVTERSREFGVLRAVGASALQIKRILVWESAMLGLLASGLGLAAGVCLSVVLTGVINRAFFGWTIDLAFPWPALLQMPVWIVFVSIVAGWLPAQRAGRLVIAEAVRSE
jgi:putative ABC transport system permease protein